MVKTVVLPPLSPKGRPEDPVVVRVFQDETGFYPTVWFQESFRLRPTFPMGENGQPQDQTDVEQLFLQDSLGFKELRADSIDAVLDNVLTRIGELFDGPEGG